MDVFAFGAIAADDDGDAAVGDIDALVKDTSGDELGVLAGAEAFQDGAPFLGWRLIGIM